MGDTSIALRDMIRETAAESAVADPARIAARVLDQLSPTRYRDTLALLLPDYVRLALSERARQDRTGSKIKQLTTAQRVSSWYSQQLTSSLFCNGTWKFLGTCTAEDLHWAAAERYRKAAEITNEADRWTKIAAFMEEHARNTVAEIDSTELLMLMDNGL